MTPVERKILDFFKAQEMGYTARTSQIGLLIWEASDPETRKRNPSAQGLALLGGRFAGPMCWREGWLCHGYDGYGWSISIKGRLAE